MHTILYSSRRGFTLIELLVVIAIIGILSSVVLASLNTARAKATDAKISSELDAIRKAAEIYYSDHGQSYNVSGVAVNDCASEMFAATTPGIAAILADLTAATPAGDPECNAADDGTGYAVSHILTSPSTATYLCIDNLGGVSTSTSALGTGTACP